jgi:hypothetical protein
VSGGRALIVFVSLLQETETGAGTTLPEPSWLQGLSHEWCESPSSFLLSELPNSRAKSRAPADLPDDNQREGLFSSVFFKKIHILMLVVIPFVSKPFDHIHLSRSAPMFRNFCKTLCLILLSATVVSSSFGGEKLRFQMKKGSTYTYVLTANTKGSSKVMGRETASKSASYFSISLTVESTGDNAITLVARVDSNVSSVESTVMRDSAMVLKEINEKRVRIILSPLGKIIKTVVIDTIAPSRMMQMTGLGNPADILRPLFVRLPEQAVGVGDTWKYNTTDTISTMGMSIVTKPNMKFKVAGTEKVGSYDCLKIAYDGTASVYGTGSRQGMEMVVQGTTKSKGTALFAPKEGIFVSVDNDATSDMNISGSGEQMFTMTQSSKSAQKMRLAK